MEFIKKEKVLLLILFLVFINPFFYGYRIAMLLLLFIFFRFEYFWSLFDVNVYYLFLFATSYELIGLFRFDYIEDEHLTIIPSFFVPSLLYLTGKYITTFYRNSSTWLFMLFFLAFTFSLIPLISILLHIYEYGFIHGTRSMNLLWSEAQEISATGLGSYFALNMAAIGLINIKRTTKFERWITILVAILFILSLICVFRLGSRTQLIIAFVSLLGTYLLNIKQYSLLKNIFYSALFIGGAYYLFQNIDEGSDLMRFYSDRLNSDEHGIATAGGRLGRWAQGLESILSEPFGWELSRFGYAHNLWLDVARLSGIIPLLFLILFTISSFKIWFKSFEMLDDNAYLKNYIVMIFISILLIFTVEPVMDGLYLLFLLFCLFIGLLKGMHNEVYR